MADRLDHLPDVKARASERSSSTRRTITEDDQRVLLATQTFVDIALGKGGHRQPSLTRTVLQRLENA
jgi:hypothetical protein